MKKHYYQPEVVMIEVAPVTTLCMSIVHEPVIHVGGD